MGNTYSLHVYLFVILENPKAMTDISVYGTDGYGSWTTRELCPGYSLAVGFELRSEPAQGSSDDTAANNLRLRCSDNNVITGDGMFQGSWTGEQICDNTHAICALRAQIEPALGSSGK